MDDFAGRRTGSECGKGVWALAKKYFDGSVTNTPAAVAMRRVNSNQCELRFETLRGLYYKLQSTPDLTRSFTDDPAGFTQAYDSSMARIDNFAGSGKFYRVISSPGP